VLGEDDLLIVTADHGCDPTFKGTDHTREYIPLLVYRKSSKLVNLGIRDQFSDVAASVSEFLGVSGFPKGVSFLGK